jgi:hypothetical protein
VQEIEKLENRIAQQTGCGRPFGGPEGFGAVDAAFPEEVNADPSRGAGATSSEVQEQFRVLE